MSDSDELSEYEKNAWYLKVKTLKNSRSSYVIVKLSKNVQKEKKKYLSFI